MNANTITAPKESTPPNGNTLPAVYYRLQEATSLAANLSARLCGLDKVLLAPPPIEGGPESDLIGDGQPQPTGAIAKFHEELDNLNHSLLFMAGYITRLAYVIGS